MTWSEDPSIQYCIKYAYPLLLRNSGILQGLGWGKKGIFLGILEVNCFFKEFLRVN